MLKSDLNWDDQQWCDFLYASDVRFPFVPSQHVCKTLKNVNASAALNLQY